MFDRITFEPKIMSGRAYIRGMRIPVSVVVGQIDHGATWEAARRTLLNAANSPIPGASGARCPRGQSGSLNENRQSVCSVGRAECSRARVTTASHRFRGCRPPA